jgi:peptidoglycan/xylan/chitin deacetylase (PgdA/CDA1 family)
MQGAVMSDFKPLTPRTIRPDPMIARDLVGYGEVSPDPRWPGGARIAVNFNLNVEGGGEATLVNGDPVSEGMLNDIGVATKAGVRSLLVESVFEYGSRRGAWRLLDIFRKFSVPISVLGVARAMEQNPDLAKACIARGHEMVSHGYRWIDYADVDEATEREHIKRAVEILTDLTGTRPLGWMTGRPGPNTRRLIAEEGGFLYDRDSLADELPCWIATAQGPHLVIPYSYEANDNRFNENRQRRKALRGRLSKQYSFPKRPALGGTCRCRNPHSSAARRTARGGLRLRGLLARQWSRLIDTRSFDHAALHPQNSAGKSPYYGTEHACL